ncbi:MAG: hypothetical protein R6U20_10470, partial [Longimonas sp.]|uniref:hypothetical protein n=1 Tax=Longimonas sp. TaxID=2039626 RepID=UPI0039765884
MLKTLSGHGGDRSLRRNSLSDRSWRSFWWVRLALWCCRAYTPACIVGKIITVHIPPGLQVNPGATVASELLNEKIAQRFVGGRIRHRPPQS